MTLFLNVRFGALGPDLDGADPEQILCGRFAEIDRL